MRTALISVACTLGVVFAIACCVTAYYMTLEPSEYTCIKRETT